MNTRNLTVRIQTPIWTGGVDGCPDRLHETSIIGSMRWWYEAIIRGLGEYACDPTEDHHCELSGKEKNDEERLAKLCPACYLFGCGGWKRRFRLSIEVAPTVPLHFRTTSSVNKNWLKRIFGGDSQNIDNLNVFYGEIILKFLIESNDTNYIRSQLVMLFNFISKYGGLGSKLQHGFGLVKLEENEYEANINGGITKLKNKLTYVNQCTDKKDIPYNLENFIFLEYDLDKDSLTPFLNNKAHLGNSKLENETRYIPCSFDLKYKGNNNFGMRNWLKEKKDEKWNESDDPNKLGTIDELLGPRSNWKVNGKNNEIADDKKTASRLCFGMPYQLDNGKYRFRIFGFAPNYVLEPDELMSIVREYMKHVFGKATEPVVERLGIDIINSDGGSQ
jgi:CRISPR-associated protein Cmr1